MQEDLNELNLVTFAIGNLAYMNRSKHRMKKIPLDSERRMNEIPSDSEKWVLFAIVVCANSLESEAP